MLGAPCAPRHRAPTGSGRATRDALGRRAPTRSAATGSRCCGASATAGSLGAAVLRQRGRLDGLRHDGVGARRQRDRPDRRQRVEQRHRSLDATARVSARSSPLRRAVEGRRGRRRWSLSRRGPAALLLADLTEHVSTRWARSPIIPAADGIGGPLRVWTARNSAADSRTRSSLAFERDERLRHGLEMLDRLRHEVLENVRLVGEESIELGEPPRRLVGRRAGRRRDQACEPIRRSPRRPRTPVSPMTSRAVLSQNTMSAQRPERRGGRRWGAWRPLGSTLLHRRRRGGQLGKPAGAAEAAEPVSHQRQMLGRRRGILRVPDVARPSSTAARVSHASIRKTLKRNCRSRQPRPPPVDRGLGGQLEAREASR